MLERLTPSPRVQRALIGVAALLVCAAGCYQLGRALDRSYPIAEWLVWRLAPTWASAPLFSLSAVTFGAFLLNKLLGPRQLPAIERLLQSMMLALVAFVLGLYLLGSLALF